jgi:hypothetical protein
MNAPFIYPGGDPLAASKVALQREGLKPSRYQDNMGLFTIAEPSLFFFSKTMVLLSAATIGKTFRAEKFWGRIVERVGDADNSRYSR